MPTRTALSTMALLLALLAAATPAQSEEAEARRICAQWATANHYPSGIEQERCRSAFPELAMDYGSYCARLRATGTGDELTLAACRAYAGYRGEPI